jgi:hypothetical protein
LAVKSAGKTGKSAMGLELIDSIMPILKLKMPIKKRLMYIIGYQTVWFRPVRDILGLIMRLLKAGEAIIGVKTGILHAMMVNNSFRGGHFEIKMPLIETKMVIMKAKMGIIETKMAIMKAKMGIMNS